MAKFRTNHIRQGRGRAGGSVRLLLLAVFMAAALIVGLRYIPVMTSSDRPQPIPVAERFFLPDVSPTVNIQHFGFGSAGVDSSSKALRWLAYPVYGFPFGKEMPQSAGSFIDPNDLWYLPDGERQSWKDSISLPSLPTWAIRWSELQEFTQLEASFSSPLFVCDGPIASTYFSSERDNETVPSGFFKVLLDLEPIRGIGFILKQGHSAPQVVPIDSIERLTGLDFYHELLLDSLEHEAEANVDTAAWDNFLFNSD